LGNLLEHINSLCALHLELCACSDAGSDRSRLRRPAANALRDCCTGAAAGPQPAAAQDALSTKQQQQQQQQECRTRLTTAAHSLLRCLQLSVTLFPDGINQRQLLAAAGQLTQHVKLMLPPKYKEVHH
jgi:hypothetical protein